MRQLPLIAVAGPTGAGKSSLALALAERFGGEIINFDSVQVYRGFDVGSAKLSAAERRGIPHHLIDIRSPQELFTAGDFASEGRALLPAIRLPILCGGTGFYLRALLRGLSPGPGRDEALRESLQARERRRPGAVRRLLARLDPAAATRIHPNDVNKSIRALELRLLAGRPTEEHFAGAGLAPLTGYATVILAPDPPRDALYRALDARCEAMWGSLLEEVRGLLAAGVPAAAKPFEALGYKQALRVVLDPALPHAPALEEMRIRTRQYAKRQWTWFRAEKDVRWLPGFGSEPETQHAAFDLVSAFVEKHS